MSKLKTAYPNPEMVDSENPEWTEEMFKAAKRVVDLPESLQQKLKRLGTRGLQKAPTKVQTAVRFDAFVLDHFKSTGPGWQARMNDALKTAIKAGIA